MKYFALLPLLFFSLFAIAQENKQAMSPGEIYAIQKANGTLQPEFIVAPPPPTPFDHAANGFYNSRGGGGGNSTAATCGCYVPPDSSWTQQVGWPLGSANDDDGAAGPLQLPFNFCFYGTTQTEFYLNINGNISFGAPYSTFTANAFPDPTFVMIAPFWGDVDLGGVGNGTVWYKITPTAAYINWVDVGYYNEHTDKVNRFSMIITDGNDPVLPPGNNVGFCYGDMQWTTGDASQGTNGFGGSAATVGANKGDGVDFIQFAQFDQPGNAFDGPFGNPDGIDWLDNKTFVFNACSNSNIPPIFTGLDLCDTIDLCVGDTFELDLEILSPENTQSTEALFDTTTLANFQVNTNTPGISADVEATLIAMPSDVGTHSIVLTAWDDGSPADTVIATIVVNIDSIPFFPSITGDTAVCLGDTLTLTCNAGFDNYSWSGGIQSDSTTGVLVGGDYYVTATIAGCTEVAGPHTVVSNEIPLITGDTLFCMGNTTNLQTGTQFDSLLWSTGETTVDVDVATGTYAVTGWQNGCAATSDSVNAIAIEDLPLAITGDTTYCEGDSVLLTSMPGFDSYQWSDGQTTQDIYAFDGTYTLTAFFDVCSLVTPPITINEFSSTAEITGPNSFCAGESITLTANNGDFYTWNPGNLPTQSITVTTPGTYTVQVTSGICTAISAQHLVVENPLPNPAISGNDWYCFEDSTVLSISPVGLQSIAWTNGATAFSQQVGVGSYSASVTDDNGCIGMSQVINVSAYGPTPTQRNIPAFCPGETTVIGYVAADWIYTFDWVGLGGGDTTRQTVSEGTYSVFIDDGFCTISDTFEVVPAPIPVAAFAYEPFLFSQTDDPVQFSDQSTIETGTIDFWYWDFGDGDSSNVQNPVKTWGTEDLYRVLLTIWSDVGCVDTVSAQYLVIDGVEEVNVFTPNNDGFNDHLVFKNLELFPAARLTVYNRWGRQVYESEAYANDWTGGKLNDGTYFYVLEVPGLLPMNGHVQLIRSSNN